MHFLIGMAFAAVLGAAVGGLAVWNWAGAGTPPPVPLVITTEDYKIESAGSLVVENHKLILNASVRARDVYEAAGSGWICPTVADFDISQQVPVQIPGLLNLATTMVRAKINAADRSADFTIFAAAPRLDVSQMSIDYGSVIVNGSPSVFDQMMSITCPAKLVRAASRDFVARGIKAKLTTDELAKIDLAVAKRNATKALRGLVTELARSLDVSAKTIAVEFTTDGEIDTMARQPSVKVMTLSSSS